MKKKIQAKFYFFAPVLLVALLSVVGTAAAIKLNLRPTTGPDQAPVRIIEVSDFQCRHCAKMAPILHKVLNEYKDLVQLTVISIPAPGNIYSEACAEFSLTANEYGKFWEAYQELFAHQSEISADYLLSLGKKMGLPEEVVRGNLMENKHRPLLKENFEYAVKDLGLTSTPTVLINQTRIEGARDADYYRYFINQELKKKGIRSPVAEVPKPAEDSKNKRQVSVVPVELIFPVERMTPQDSVLKVKVGQPAPDFDLPTIRPGINVKLSDFRDKKNVVLSFVPAAWTPQCSAQWPEYNENKDRFANLNTEIIGITEDNIPTLYSWAVSMGMPWFTIASDFWPHGKVAGSYGVLRGSGISERALLIVDKKGIIRYVHVHDINTRPDIKDLFEQLEKLQTGN